MPQYRTGVFIKLKERFPGLTVLYGEPHKSESLRNDTSALPDYFYKSKNTYLFGSPGIFFTDIIRTLAAKRPEVVISVFNVGNLNLYLLFLLRKVFGFKLILWSFGYDPVRGFRPSSNFIDRIRLLLSQSADAVLFYWDKGRQIIEAHSRRTEHYFTAPNTLDTDKLELLRMNFDVTGKEAIKNELGVREQSHFVYIGRLIKDKQIDLLIKAFGLYKRAGREGRLTIVGDGPERDKLLRLAAETNDKITFKGEITDDEAAGKWIFASDALVMPGRLGLSVAHAFSFGTPVISQKKDGFFHGEGIGYIRDGINGLLAEDGDVEGLADRMRVIAEDKDLHDNLSKGALETLREECSVQRMMDGFENSVSHCLGYRRF